MILVGDCRTRLRELPVRSAQTCITSPPYFGLRDYGTAGQIGLEPTPDEFVHALVDVFREVRRVLRDDGTVWLNLGDSYAGSWGAQSRPPGEASTLSRNGGTGPNPKMLSAGQIAAHPKRTQTGSIPADAEYKPKDLLGVPWMVAFALRADGWYLRSDIIWAKPNPMPESVTDRPTKAHEYLFLLSKGPRYFYDAAAIREGAAASTQDRAYLGARPLSDRQQHMQDAGMHGASDSLRDYSRAARNKRSVWTVATQPYAGAHFATFPPKLIEPCVLAGSPPKCCGVCGAPWRRVVEREGGLWEQRKANGEPMRQGLDGGAALSGVTPKVGGSESRTVGWESTCTHADDTGRSVILDPFAGAGTVGVVCGWHGREHVGIELNPAYAFMADTRIALEGRPGGPPNGHEPASVLAGQLGLLEGLT